MDQQNGNPNESVSHDAPGYGRPSTPDSLPGSGRPSCHGPFSRHRPFGCLGPFGRLHWIAPLLLGSLVFLAGCDDGGGDAPAATAAPSSVSVTAGNGEVTIGWGPVNGASGYNIYWDVVTGVTKDSEKQFIEVTSPHTHGDLTNGTAYFYVVTAVSGAGESAESGEVSATPARPAAAVSPAPRAPDGVSATAGDGEVVVDWDDVAGASSYNIYWDTSPGVTKRDGHLIEDPSAPKTHGNRLNGIQYFYVVTAVNSGGESAKSAEVGATPVGPATINPDLYGTWMTNRDDLVAWIEFSPENDYRIYIRDTGGYCELLESGTVREAAGNRLFLTRLTGVVTNEVCRDFVANESPDPGIGVENPEYSTYLVIPDFLLVLDDSVSELFMVPGDVDWGSVPQGPTIGYLREDED